MKVLRLYLGSSPEPTRINPAGSWGFWPYPYHPFMAYIYTYLWLMPIGKCRLKETYMDGLMGYISPASQSKSHIFHRGSSPSLFDAQSCFGPRCFCPICPLNWSKASVPSEDKCSSISCLERKIKSLVDRIPNWWLKSCTACGGSISATNTQIASLGRQIHCECHVIFYPAYMLNLLSQQQVSASNPRVSPTTPPK